MGDHEELRPQHSARENSTLEQIGQHFGITKERVRQIKGRAMKKEYPYQYVCFRFTDRRFDAYSRNPRLWWLRPRTSTTLRTMTFLKPQTQ